MTQLQPSPRHRAPRRRRRLPSLPHAAGVVLTILTILAAGFVLGGLIDQPFHG